MDSIHSLLTRISDFLWGLPLIVALIGTGLYLTFRLNFVQFIHLPRALKMISFPRRMKSGMVKSAIFRRS